MLKFRAGFEGLEKDKIVYQEREARDLTDFLEDIKQAISHDSFRFMWIEKEKEI